MRAINEHKMMTEEYEMMTVEYEMMTVEYGMTVEYEPYYTVSST